MAIRTETIKQKGPRVHLVREAHSRHHPGLSCITEADQQPLELNTTGRVAISLEVCKFQRLCSLHRLAPAESNRRPVRPVARDNVIGRTVLFFFFFLAGCIAELSTYEGLNK